eukprot:5553335-Prymnesium_polylepis.4
MSVRQPSSVAQRVCPTPSGASNTMSNSDMDASRLTTIQSPAESGGSGGGAGGAGGDRGGAGGNGGEGGGSGSTLKLRMYVCGNVFDEVQLPS